MPDSKWFVPIRFISKELVLRGCRECKVGRIKGGAAQRKRGRLIVCPLLGEQFGGYVLPLSLEAFAKDAHSNECRTHQEQCCRFRCARGVGVDHVASDVRVGVLGCRRVTAGVRDRGSRQSVGVQTVDTGTLELICLLYTSPSPRDRQ